MAKIRVIVAPMTTLIGQWRQAGPDTTGFTVIDLDVPPVLLEHPFSHIRRQLADVRGYDLSEMVTKMYVETSKGWVQL